MGTEPASYSLCLSVAHSLEHSSMQPIIIVLQTSANLEGTAVVTSDEVIPPHKVRDAVLRFTAPTTWDTELPDPSGLKCTLFPNQ